MFELLILYWFVWSFLCLELLILCWSLLLGITFAPLQDMFNDEEVKAIICTRGGYGMIRIVDKLDFKRFIQHPKWVVGLG